MIWQHLESAILSLMNAKAQDLVLAVLSRVKERGGTSNKTKLLKLLYLADIEHFRKYGETLTGFDWIFFLFGPWAAEYDSLLNELENRDLVRTEAWSKGDAAGARLDPVEKKDLGKVVESADEYFRIQHQVDTWADRSLPELLDYVYFDTEPMKEAESLKRLDFSKVDRTPPVLYKRVSSGIPPEKLKRKRAALLEARARNNQGRAVAMSRYGKPTYGESYRSALESLAEEEER
jgi:hypothetical protein